MNTMQQVLQHAAPYGEEERQELMLAMIDHSAGVASVAGSSVYAMEHRSFGSAPPMSVCSPVAGL